MQKSAQEISCLTEQAKNSILSTLIDEINVSRDLIKSSNSIDIEDFKLSKNFTKSFIDRLLLDDSRIDGMLTVLKK